MKQMYQLSWCCRIIIKTNDQGKIEKALVKSYHQPNDTTLDIELKDNIKFQNGQKLTAEKVKY